MVSNHSTRHQALSIMTEDQATRFWTLVTICAHGVICDHCCWEWQGLRETNGYGRLQIGLASQGTKTKYSAHRLAYFFAKGEIAPGLSVCHTCDNRCCVQPAHLFLGTTRDNMHDAMQKNRLATGDRNGSRRYPERLHRGKDHHSRLRPERLARGKRNGAHTQPKRLPRGEHHGNTTLTNEAVKNIRALKGRLTVREIATVFNLHFSTVARILRRQSWGHVPDEEP